MKKLIYTVLLFVFVSACIEATHFKYEPSQSAVITNLRSKSMFEYSSPLTAGMCNALAKLERGKFISTEEYDAILETAIRLENERPTLGCYFTQFDFNVDGRKSSHTVIMDWNKNAGVIVRFFTADEAAFKKLPFKSF